MLKLVRFKFKVKLELYIVFIAIGVSVRGGFIYRCYVGLLVLEKYSNDVLMERI